MTHLFKVFISNETIKDLLPFLIPIYFPMGKVGKKQTQNSLQTMHGQSRGENKSLLT